MEFVYVVPRRALFPESYPHGYRPFSDPRQSASLQELVEREGFFVERAAAEREPSWKQPIPYTCVVGPRGVLVLERTKAGGDARLHNKLSIGVGGHVNPIDAPGPDGEPSSEPSARRGLLGRTGRRELAEELELVVAHDASGRPCEPVLAGLINDETNSVGAVHVGWVQVLRVDDARVAEVDVLQGRFREPAELVDMAARGANFETWSALLIERLDELIAVGNAESAAPEICPPHASGTTSAKALASEA